MPTMNTSGSPSQNGNSSNATAAASPTSAPTVALSSYDELMSVASSLSESAASGGLDTGYDITDVAMALPDDVCGVAGGDGTTCYDACGVANGDNSTCADVCGKVNGDGTSCLSTGAGFYTCEAEVEWYSLRNTGDSMYKERTQAYQDAPAQRRRATTLTALLGAEACFDLIKLDVQGAELQVLKGGPLAFSNAQVVFMELGNVIADYNTGPPSLAEKIAFMDNAGFVPFDIPEVAYTAKGRANRVLKFIDIVWVRRGSEYARRAQKVLNSQLWR